MEFKKIRKAIQEDFKELYNPQFTTNYKAERMFRNIEIGIMQFDNLKKLLSREMEVIDDKED